MERVVKGIAFALVAFGLSGAAPAVAADLFTYAAPGALQYSNHNDDFTVQARVPGGEWKDLGQGVRVWQSPWEEK